MLRQLIAAMIFGIFAALPAAAQDMVELPDTCKEIELNMIKCALAEDVTIKDAVDGMKSKSVSLNFKQVGHKPLSADIKAKGGKSGQMDIYEFCDSLIASKMVQQSLAFAGFLPCRIALVEDDKNPGKAFLITLNMDKTLGAAGLPAELKKIGVQVRNNLYAILVAGIEGDL